MEQRLAADAGAIQAQLDLVLGTFPPGPVTEGMGYATRGGKRIRGFLVTESARLHGVDAAAALWPACAIEALHAYSLVHDDLPAMDDDDLRRGQPTVHKAWDEATAILAGDALLTLAFGGLAHAGLKATVIAGLADAAGSVGMVGGQSLDLAFEQQRPDTELLEAMFRGKTGALIRAAVELPARLGPAPPAQHAALAAYGDAIGV